MTTKAKIIKDIRSFCIDCMGGHQGYVTDCESAGCALHPYRMGKDPAPNEKKAEIARERLARRNS